MSKNLRLALIAAACLAVLAALIALVAPLLPTTTIRGEIERRVTTATGRAFRINGPLAFSLFPSLGLRAQDVTLANAPGGRAPFIVQVATMRLGVKVLPLLSGRIEVAEVVLDEPEIALEVAPDGTANWTLVRTRTEQAGLHVPSSVTFAGVTVTHGQVTYDDLKLGVHRVLDDLDAKIAVTRIARPARISGAFTHRGRRLNFSINIDKPQTLLSGDPAWTTLSINSDFMHAGFIGFVSSSSVRGYGSLRTLSLKDVAAWLGHGVTAGTGLGALNAKARVALEDQQVALTDIKARLDAMTITGELAADMRAKVPDIDGTLGIDRIDLNNYLSLGKPTARSAPRASGPPGGGWAKQPIALDPIKLLNGHLTLIAGEVVVRNLRLGKTTIALTLADGLMQAHLDPIVLYGGTGKADLMADARGPVPLLHNRLTFTSIAMRPFLADAIGVDKIDGTGTISLDVISKGSNSDAIMRALSGKGAVVLARGHIRGVDMGRVARTVQTILSAGATGNSATTDFDQFGGSFAIQNGILWNGDLHLSSAFLHMTGQGHLDLGKQTIAYRIEPKAAIGGRMNLLEVGVPFIISGSWNQVHYVPDMAGAVTGLVGSVLSKGTEPIAGLIDGLTGRATAKPGPKKNSRSVGDTLKGVFGIH